jgi:hypothetical protein
MPWSLIINVIFKIIDLILSRSQKKNQMKKSMLEFAKKHDEKIMQNVSLKKEYDKILKEEYDKKNERS